MSKSKPSPGRGRQKEDHTEPAAERYATSSTSVPAIGLKGVFQFVSGNWSPLADNAISWPHANQIMITCTVTGSTSIPTCTAIVVSGSGGDVLLNPDGNPTTPQRSYSFTFSPAVITFAQGAKYVFQCLLVDSTNGNTSASTLPMTATA
jgi:hypothetical protein